jgi:hypothetical protein
MRKIMVGAAVVGAMVGVAGPAQAIIGGETAGEVHTWIVDLGHQRMGPGAGVDWWRRNGW